MVLVPDEFEGVVCFRKHSFQAVITHPDVGVHGPHGSKNSVSVRILVVASRTGLRECPLSPAFKISGPVGDDP
jgi:hypothetical protein